MLTREQALTAQEFHANGCTRVIGPRGGPHVGVTAYRRASQTHTWKRRSECFQFTVKFGMNPRTHTITELSAAQYHVPTECPLLTSCCVHKSHIPCSCSCHD